MNPHRGEVTIELGGRSWVMRPTLEAIAEIDRVVGPGVGGAYRLMLSGDLKFGEMTEIIAAGIRAGGDEQATARGVAPMLFEEGMFSERLMRSLIEFLHSITHGGRPLTTEEPELGEAQGLTTNTTPSVGSSG